MRTRQLRCVEERGSSRQPGAGSRERTKMTALRPIVWVVGLASVLTATGCGSSSSNSTASETTSEASAPAKPTATPNPICSLTAAATKAGDDGFKVALDAGYALDHRTSTASAADQVSRHAKGLADGQFKGTTAEDALTAISQDARDLKVDLDNYDSATGQDANVLVNAANDLAKTNDCPSSG